MPDNNPFLLSQNGKGVEQNPFLSSTIEPSENILQRAIRSSREAGVPPGAFTPATGEEALDVAKVAGRNLAPTDPGLVGVGASFVGGGAPPIEIPAPETQFGKDLEVAGQVAPLAFLGIKGVEGVAKGVGNVFKSFQPGGAFRGVTKLGKQKVALTEATEKTTGFISDQITRLKDIGAKLLKRQGRESRKTGFIEEKAAKEAATEKFKQANDIFGDGIDKIKAKSTRGGVGDVILKAADEIDDVIARENLETLANKIAERGLLGGEEALSARELNSTWRGVLNSIRDVRTKAILNKHFLDSLDDAAPGLKELKAAHEPVYKAARLAKSLKRGPVTRVGTGSATEPEVKALLEAEGQVGTKGVAKASKIRERGRASQREIGKRVGAKEAELGSVKAKASKAQSEIDAEVKKIMKRRGNLKSVRNVVGTIGGVGFLADQIRRGLQGFGENK